MRSPLNTNLLTFNVETIAWRHINSRGWWRSCISVAVVCVAVYLRCFWLATKEKKKKDISTSLEFWDAVAPRHHGNCSLRHCCPGVLCNVCPNSYRSQLCLTSSCTSLLTWCNTHYCLYYDRASPHLRAITIVDMHACYYTAPETNCSLPFSALTRIQYAVKYSKWRHITVSRIQPADGNPLVPVQ